MKKSYNPQKDSDNMIIHGNNLDALKSLLPNYRSRINCIYIDPPYNTGSNNWKYTDNVDHPVFKSWLNKEIGIEDMSRHEKWLCMMWPRLQILKELLTDDGIIFISIDDNEYHHLRVMMDDMFGEDNFIATCVWEGGLKNDSKYFSVSHDYILCYSKKKSLLSDKGTRWRHKKDGIDKIYKQVEHLRKQYKDNYRKISSELKTWYKSLPKNDPAFKHRHYNEVDKRGLYFPGDISWPGGGGPDYEVIHPITKKPVKVPVRGWLNPDKNVMEQQIADNRIHFGDDETTVPKIKRYLHETESKVMASVIYKDRRAAKQMLDKILSYNEFENPKDVSVIKDLISMVTPSDGIILDSFAGSGTTAQAVLELNKEDGGNRRFILVELEDYADKITAERVRRVIKGVPGVNDDNLKKGLGGSFTYYTLGKAMDKEKMLKGDLPEYKNLAAYLLYKVGIPTDGIRIEQTASSLFYKDVDTDYYLLYTPNVEMLRGNDCTLTEGRIKKIEKRGRNAVVFAPDANMSQLDLAKRKIEFSRIPYPVDGG
ncbi:adenine specific DNA methylase [Cenarchaeum symbiosum A]|uniref:Adenine specific DNA methylase n=1 Tax=Cenarchaeum symbiosum (strain A) TaxID=414004 RepID=A0RWM0_CENSY|nr:adenine specific DNA methylase [Cenarchaeum symbiosum A]